MMRNAPLLALAVGSVLAAGAGAAEKLTFDVASIKPSEPFGPGKPMIRMGMRGGPGTPDPGRITWTGATLMNLLQTAYEVERYQVTGPDWLDSERFDVVVT